MSEDEREFFAVPLGVQVQITIDSPADQLEMAGADSREVLLSGRIDESPVFLTTDGGHVELFGNGSLVSGAIDVGGTGTGTSGFSTPLALAPGENHLEVVAYAGEGGWGLETPASGEVGRASVTVSWEATGSAAPVLSGLVHPSTAPGPSGTVDFAFQFSDPDGDILEFHQKLTGAVGGSPFSSEGEGLVRDEAELQAMDGGTFGTCHAPLTYHQVQAGDWVTQEFWVVDAEGQASNHLVGTVTIVGGINALAAGAGEPAIGTSFLPSPH